MTHAMCRLLPDGGLEFAVDAETYRRLLTHGPDPEAAINNIINYLELN